MAEPWCASCQFAEGLLPDQCGEEAKPPQDTHTFCIDCRPALPVALLGSTVVGGVCFFLVQLPLIQEMSGSACWILVASFLVLYLVTTACLVYCAVSDPGTLGPEVLLEAQLEQGRLPPRTHKSWQYRQPIRRYDHYCKWLTNCIGLLNHREFVVMVTGLVVIGVAGAAVDMLLALTGLFWGRWLAEIFIIAHLAYSLGIVTLAGPILGLHIGFISRNELAQEWKNDEFYVYRTPEGEVVQVHNLSDEEFSKRFDEFLYDRSLNHWDNGIERNCFDFWCTPRWAPDQLGDF